MAIKVNFDRSLNILEHEVDPSWKRYTSENYKKYRKDWEKASKGFLFRFPLCVEIESSYYCNLKCPMCARQVFGTFNEKGLIERKLYSKILREATEHKMPAIMMDHEAEPLTNPHITDMTKEAKEAGILDIWMHTNANLLNKITSEKLIRNGLTKINFSIDAVTKETYEKIRPGGDFDKVIRNVMSFLKLKDKLSKKYIRTRVSFVIQEENKHEKKNFFEFWKSKVNLISFQTFKDFNKFNNQTLRRCECKNDFICDKPWQMLIIRFNGDVVPCGMPFRKYSPDDYLLGNLYTDTIEECWNSSKLNKIRKFHKDRKYYKIPFCRDCISAYNQV